MGLCTSEQAQITEVNNCIECMQQRGINSLNDNRRDIAVGEFSAIAFFFFFLESIRLINLRLCGAPVPSPYKVRYTHGKTGYINVLPSEPKKCLRKIPPSTTTPATGPSPNKCMPPPPRPFRPSPDEQTNTQTNNQTNEYMEGNQRRSILEKNVSTRSTV